MATFSERLKQLRNEKGLTQQEIADKMGVNRVTYTNWENGIKEPKLDMIVQLATEFNCTLDYLLGTSDVNALEIGKSIEGMSKDEVADLQDKLIKNILQIEEVAKMKFNLTEEQMIIMHKMLLDELKDNGLLLHSIK